MAAGVLLAVGVAGLLWLRAQRAAVPRSCPPGRDALSLPGDDQLETPVILSKSAEVKWRLNGAPYERERVALLAPGRHTLRAEATGVAAAELTFHVEAFRPAAFDAEVDHSAGAVSLLFLGARCDSCPKAERPEALGVEPAQRPFGELEAAATLALTRGDWPGAAKLLEQVQPGARGEPGFLRPATYVLQASDAQAEAHAAVAALKSVPVVQLLHDYDAAVESEAAREHQYLVRRWNAVTEVYARLLALEGGAPAAMQQASQDLARASADFARASKEGSAFAQRASLEAAEAQVKALVASLRAARPRDCDFQAKVSAAL